MSRRAFIVSALFLSPLVACGASPPPPASTCTSTPMLTPTASSTSTSAPTSTSASTSPPAPKRTHLELAALSSGRSAELARLLSEEVGPRLAGSPGDKLAVAWALKTMTSLGFQNVHAEPVTIPVWKRGEERAEIVSPTHQSLAITALGWSGSTGKNGVTGEVVEVISLDQLKALKKEDVKGKIVFGNVVMRKSADGTGYGEAVPMRFAGPKIAMDLGALAFVMRNSGTAEDRNPHTGATGLRDVKNPIAAGALATVDAELLHDTLARDPGTKISIVLTPTRGPDAQSANVVGEVVGEKHPDEIVLLGAHLDSWDLARGAIDDGTGCGIVLDAARLVAEWQKPERTIRVVLFAAEENSGAGGKAYLASHTAAVEKHVLALEADSGSARVISSRFFGDPSKKHDYESLAESLEALHVAPLDGDGHPGSDITPLVRAGVATIELRQDMSHYFDVHHGANDTQAEIDLEGIRQATAVFADTAWLAAAGADFGRAPPMKDEHW